MPYKIRRNKEGFKVHNTLKGHKDFQFHSHDRKKLDEYLQLRMAYSNHWRGKTMVKKHLRAGRVVQSHPRRIVKRTIGKTRMNEPDRRRIDKTKEVAMNTDPFELIDSTDYPRRRRNNPDAPRGWGGYLD